MKTRAFKLLSVVAVMTVCLLIGAGTSAQAQDASSQALGRVVIVDVQRVLSESAAGKNIQSQFDKEQARIEEEAAKKDAALKSKRDELVKKQPDMEKDEFVRQGNQFQQEIATARNALSAHSRNLKAATAEAVKKLRLQMVQVVSDLANEEGYALVMSKQNIILAEKSMDVTGDVVARLNKAVKKIKVDLPSNK